VLRRLDRLTLSSSAGVLAPMSKVDVMSDLPFITKSASDVSC
jgi:hypothetical protein